MPHSPCAGHCANVTSPFPAAPRALGPTARRARAPRRPFRRLLRHAVRPEGTRGPPVPPVLAHGPRPAARARGVRAAGAQPGDLPGLGGRAAPVAHFHGVRTAEVPGHSPGQGLHRAKRCSRGSGDTSTTAAPGLSTSISAGSGPSSARSTPTSFPPCARSATASARAAGASDP